MDSQVNRYAGKCACCKKEVDRGCGIVRKEDGRWMLYCNACANEDERLADPGIAAYVAAQEQAAYDNSFR